MVPRLFAPFFLTSCLLLGLGCGSESPPLSPSPPPPPPPRPIPHASTLPGTQTSTQTSTQTGDAPPVDKPPAQAADPGPPFPPPSFPAPFERTKKPTDGVYALVEEGRAGETKALARALVHPHSVKPHPSVVIVAIDLRAVDLVMVAGTEEPESSALPKEKRPGLVKPEDLPSLLAVFNGGFMAKHGMFGMMVDGNELLPVKDDGCLVALLDDGSVRIGSPAILTPIRPRMRSFRQTPPCLVEDGATHAKLPQEDTARLWGAAIGGNREIRRTALGLDATGKTLLFGIGEWVWARDLAVAMKAAGAVSAAELDINWSYTRFLLYDKQNPPEVVSTLIDKVEYTKTGYVVKPAPRDFFYLKVKAASK